MEVKEAIRTVLKELILPEINALRQEIHEVRAELKLTNQRLDDVNLHLADQSRRIDELIKG